MQSVTLFNNKGGVGKTTLACNIAAHLSADYGSTVLLIDLDPQCNATQLLFDENTWEDIYGDHKTSSQRTILKALARIREGDSSVVTDLEVRKSPRFDIDVVPGHPNLAAVEDRLSASWVDFTSGDLGGARRSLWVRSLMKDMEYDYIILDVGPSLGALNRTVLAGSDAFVTPMAADMFSLYALENIGSWLTTWGPQYQRARIALQENTQDIAGVAQVPEQLPIFSGYLGYTVQQYVTKTSGDTRRSINAYEKHRQEIPERVSALRPYTGLSVEELDIGLVPNMFSMVPLAQAAHAPIRNLTNSDGIRGAQVSQRARYVEILKKIVSNLVRNADSIKAGHDF